MKEYKLKINGNDYDVVITDIVDSVAVVEVNGTSYKVEVETPGKKAASAAPKAPAAPAPVKVQSTVAKPTVTVKAPAAAANETSINSPLPGVVLEISVKVGDAVKRGQKLMVLEAMKMENVIESSTDGTVTSIKVNANDSVLEGATLLTIG